MAAALAAIAALFAQGLADLTPPPIAFAPWREVDRDDTLVEYVETFPSALITGTVENDTVPLRILVPANSNGPIPVVLITHYWGASDLRGERALAEDLVGRGIGAAIMTLPYHLSRTPPGKRSGELAIVPDPAKLRQTLTQAVLDVRRSLDFLDSRPDFLKSPRGLAGTSLGALVTALGYATDSRVTHAAFILGGVDFAGILWNSSRVVLQRDALRHQGYTESRIREELKPVEPLTYLPRETPGTTFVISAKYDTVVPGGNSAALVRALGEPKRLQIDTGHYGGIFVQRKVLREVARFFGSEMTGTTYVPPSRIVAPTLRLGVLSSIPNGFDLAAGMDIFALDPRRDAFGTLLLTARGPQLFIGRNVFQGLALGVIGSFGGKSRLGIGAFWSAVL
jgi:dienelactone hydrolase